MIKKILTFFTETVFTKEPGEYRNPAVRWSVRQYKLLFYTARGMLEHATMVHSAALTFYTLMSVVPILAVIFAVVNGFGLTEGLLENLYGVFPQSPEVIDYVVDFATRALAHTRDGVVAAVGVAMLFWSVVKVFGSIESAFNHIWEVKSTRSLARKFTDYIAIVMVAPLLWVSVGALGKYAQSLPGIGDGALFGVLSRLTSWLVSCVIFIFLYVALPNTKVRLSSALMPGILAGTAFLLFQWGYFYLQRMMTSYNAIYGSFAALPLLLIWMQISWQILLFGGELSFAYQNIERFNQERESLLISYDDRRKVILSVMLVVLCRFRDEGGALSASEIRRRLDLPMRIVNDVLYQLTRAGLLLAIRSETDEKEETFAPARDIASLTVYGVLEAVDDCGSTPLDLTSSPELVRIAAELERIKAGARDSVYNVKLIDLK